MTQDHFDPPLLIRELQSRTVSLELTPFFYNAGGEPCYLDRLPPEATLIQPVPCNPQAQAGRPYRVRGLRNTKLSPGFGVEYELDLAAEEVVFEPLWATAEHAAAFGITVIQPGQGLRIDSRFPELQHMHLEYGVFAGHWSPYQGTQNRLCTTICTDLEHHDFPHLFISCDPVKPLVLSVARYWPAEGRICMADLWIPQGWSVFLPAQPDNATAPCVDLHNNRNSARACWGDLFQDRVHTQTLLRENDDSFRWYWNPLPTVHSRPPAPAPQHSA